ncbi:MAG: flagellar hook-length control protein FliK [Campylobacterales bacterium]|nr:flagellar hook-length control protein FliK [Campylobacterales bacterium]
MIVLANKSKTAQSSPLSLAPSTDSKGVQNSKGTLPFSVLLERFGKESSDGKVTQALVKSNATTSAETLQSEKNTATNKADTLLAMLKGESASKEQNDTLQSKAGTSITASDALEEKQQSSATLTLNPQISQKMSVEELKSLIVDAKRYLKEQILSTDGFKKSEIAALPKTLKGLTQVAQKLGIDVSKITLEEVKESAKKADKQELKVTTPLESKQSKAESKETAKSTLQTADDLAALQKKSKTQATQQNVQKESVATQNLVENKNAVSQKEQKSTPLFMAQSKNEISTEEIVTAKANALELKKPKERSDENLKLLLRTDKNAKSEAGLTPDFSVATARVIAPAPTTPATPQAVQSLESLLQGEAATENTTQSKLDGLSQTSKSDSLDVKINEAKQMIKYLSQDVKTAIEDYKSPFTRVKVQLNPQKLGEIDLTVVQRGKNLHIALSANNTAINTLAMHANDLKVQLQNSGINNASLNFSNNPQSQDGSSAQQQSQQQQRQEAHKEYNYFEAQEANEEIINSLEIVVPHYA